MPMQHEHATRLQAVDGLMRATSAHQNLLRRLAGDHQFADQFEQAAETGDVNGATALFAQAAGVPVSEIQVERAPVVVGERSDVPEFRVENAALWTPVRTGARSMMAKSRTMVKLCLFGYCWSLVTSKEA